MTVALECRNLTRKFRGVVALNGVSLAIPQGEVVGLIGPNGAGKTTLLHVWSGLTSPTSGTVTYHGDDITRWPASRRVHQGLVGTFQIVRPFERLSVRDNVAIGALFGHTTLRKLRHARRRAQEVLALVELEAFADRPALVLSTAQRKRLELGRALAAAPRVLLLDEVMSGLNPTEVEEAIAIVAAIAKTGMTIVVVEHVMRVVRALCSRIVVLDRGAVLADGSPDDVMGDRRVIAAYLGDRYSMQSSGAST